MTLNKYQEVMERLTVSEQLRERTLKRVQQGAERRRRPKLLPLLPLAAAAVLVLALLPLGTQMLHRSGDSGTLTAGAVVEQAENAAMAEDAQAPEEPEGEAKGQSAAEGAEEVEVQEAALPPREVDSLQELARSTGLELRELTGLPFEAEQVTCLVYSDRTAEILYAGEGRSLYWRTSARREDNSGDYTDYASVEKETIAGRSVTVKGDGAEISLALWSEGEQSYSISADPALTREELSALLEGLGE